MSRRARLFLGAVAIAGTACASANFEAWPVEPKNPAIWTFDLPSDDARTLILAKFCLEEEPLWIAWQEPPEGEDIRLRAGVLGIPLPEPGGNYLSPVYHHANGPCIMFVGFRLRVTSPSPGRTTVQVIAEGMRVVAGKTSGFLRVHGPAWILKPAEPTTVEEYTILRRCGEAFGVHDMPETVVPAEGVEAVVEALVERDGEPSANATLAFLAGHEATDALVAALDRDGPGAAGAARMLGRLRATAALPALQRACKSPHREVRESAAEAIRVIRRAKEPSVDDLLAQLLSKAATDRLEAAIALVSTGREIDRARPVLEPFLESEIPSERWRAAAALVRLRRLGSGG